MGEIGRDPPAMRVLAGRQGRARGRADGRVRRRIARTGCLRRRAGRCARSPRGGVSEAGEVAPAQVVDQDHNDVRPRRRTRGMGLVTDEDERRWYRKANAFKIGRSGCWSSDRPKGFGSSGDDPVTRRAKALPAVDEARRRAPASTELRRRGRCGRCRGAPTPGRPIPSGRPPGRRAPAWCDGGVIGEDIAVSDQFQRPRWTEACASASLVDVAENHGRSGSGASPSSAGRTFTPSRAVRRGDARRGEHGGQDVDVADAPVEHSRPPARPSASGWRRSTRVPPSYTVSLAPRYGPLLLPTFGMPPLSLKNRTRVLCGVGRASTAARIWPMA